MKPQKDLLVINQADFFLTSHAYQTPLKFSFSFSFSFSSVFPTSFLFIHQFLSIYTMTDTLNRTLSQSQRSSWSASSCSTTPTTASSKPHKAHQPGWVAMKGLRTQLAGCQVGLDHFRILKRVGGGDIGNVYLCQIRNPAVGAPACLYAMKVVDREALSVRNKLGRADMEREILGMLDHPFLPTLYAQFDASHYSCFVMEFCPGGDLFALRLRQPSRRFNISSAKFYAAETLLALEYLHMMGIIYRDLKPENVLVREDGHIMLSDFDLSLKCEVVPKLLKPKKLLSSIDTKNITSSRCSTPIHPVILSCFSAKYSKSLNKSSPKVTTVIKQSSDDHSSNHYDDNDDDDDDDDDPVVFDTELVAEPIEARSRSFVGTHEYLAPEVISGLGHGSAVDWWTFGVFLYEMLYGKTPFKAENNEKTLRNILKQPVKFPNVNMIMTNPKEYEELVSAQDLISKLLVKNPKKRLGSMMGANEIKRHGFFKGVNWALIRSVNPPLVPKLLSTTSFKPLSKKEREEPYQPHNHFDYF